MSIHLPDNPAINPIGGGAADQFAATKRVSRFSIDYEDTSAKTLGTFPAGTVFTGVTVATTTTFNDTGTDTIDIGVDGNPDSLVDGGTLAASGSVLVATVLAAGQYLSAEDVLTATYIGQNSDATTGAAEILVEWIAPEPS